MPVSSAAAENAGRRSILERLRRGEWPSFEDGLVLLVIASLLSKPLTNFALALCWILFARDWRRGRIQPQATPLDGAVLAWAFTSLLAGITSIDPVQSFRDLRNLGHWSVYYLLAWGIVGGVSLRGLQNAWLAAGAACALQAMAQGAFAIDLLGRASIVPRGFFGGHLELGHYMVILLGLAFARSAAAKSPREREVLLATLLAFGTALILSGGRGPWLAFVAVAVAWISFRPSRAAVVGLALVVVLQLVFLARQPQGLESFYTSYVTFARNEAQPVVSEERLASNLWRLWMWREGLMRFAVRPVSGTGVETTGELSQDFRTPYADLAVAHLHSNYFEILMTRGFFGLAAFLFLLLSAARRMRAEMREANDGESAGAFFAALAAIIAHAVHGLTQFTFGATWIQIGFYIALGLGVGEAMRRRRIDGPRVDARDAAWVVATTASAFLLLPWLAAHPWLSGSLATLAALDLAARSASGGSSPLGDALLGSFLFVAAAAIGLLGIGSGRSSDGVAVLLAASVSFAVAWAGWRSREIARWLKGT